MPSYQPLIPTGNVNLDIDYQNIQDNFQQLDTIYGIDHLPFSNGSAQQGYHTAIHLISQSTTATKPPNNYPPAPPTTVANVGQIFSASVNDGYNTGTALFFLTGGGSIRQLTSNFDPLVATNGYTFLPGGVVMQWGIGDIAAGTAVTGVITFATSNRAFAKNCFNVIVSLVAKSAGTTSAANCISVKAGTVSTTQFTWLFNGNSGSYTNFYWFAIGQ